MNDWSKFPEPRGWALRWEGSALGVDQGRATTGAPRVWAPRWERLVLPQERAEISFNGHARVRFPGPQPWALHWDGPALSGDGDRQDEPARQHAPSV